LTQNYEEDNQEVGQVELGVIREEIPARRAEILNQGAIPEFVRVRELFEVYKVFTEANLKNKVLVKNQVLQTQDPAEIANLSEEFIEESNIKDDIALIQYKLVRTSTLKTVNTFSFVNLPASKMQDVNARILSEIVSKYNENGSTA
jgi:hypothetical protein